MSRLFAALMVVAVATFASASPGRSVDSAPCGQAAVTKRMGAMVRALNGARGDRFAAGFAQRGRWYPFTRTLTAPLSGRPDIQAFAILRISAEDRWKVSGLRRVASGRYTIRVKIATRGRRVGAGPTRVTVDCKSGLVTSWTGPALRMPPIVDDD
jgi:hypothetical protein